MTSARRWKTVLAQCLLLICVCVGLSYFSFGVDNIDCQLRHLFGNVVGVQAHVQARMDAQIELVTGVVGPDRSVTSIKWGGKVRLRIEEYACGYEAHWSRAYGSDDSPAEVLARFRQRLVGWQVERESEDVIYLKNRDNTARLKLTIIRPRKTPHDDFDFGPSLSSAAPGYATVYEIDLRYGEPHVRIPG